MASSRLTDRDAPAVVTNGATVPQHASKLPSKLRLLILISLSLFVRAALLPAVADFTGNELGVVSRVDDDILHVAGHFSYKVFLLWLGWQMKLDYVDVSALAVITNTPFTYLLTTYYEISKWTAAALIGVEVVSIALPTYLLQSRSSIHNPKASLRNRFLLDSFQVQQSTALLAVGVYVTVLYATLKTGWLNVLLVLHFDLPTLEGAYSETPLSIAGKVFLAGFAAREFLLNPSIGAQSVSGSATPVRPFDAATADLLATLKHNFWFWSKRTRTLIRQTIVLSAFIFANTVQRVLTLQGTDFSGAAGYAGIWVLATLITLGWWAWVGETDFEE